MVAPGMWREMYVDESATLATGILAYTLGAIHEGEPDLFALHNQRLHDQEDACDLLYVVRTNPELSEECKTNLLARRAALLAKWKGFGGTHGQNSHYQVGSHDGRRPEASGRV